MTMRNDLHNVLKRRWLTPLDALRMCGCLSLSQRCGEFRRAGLAVQDKWVHLPNGKRVKSYRIVKDQPCYFTEEGAKDGRALG
jgi:hypothetical protein